jgi:peptidoglycan/LPS O-acetylase OafA/YrhL
MRNSEGRIESLDGLRAVSITLVIFSHLIGVKGFIVPERVGRVFELGELGVRVFFVISGFLITSILLKELEDHRTINLRRFYFRRTLRIFPPYYLFILSIVIIQAAGLISLNQGDLPHALTYTSNYHLQRSWYVGHTWSLAVEEQFYVVWPAVLILFGKRRGLLAALAFVLIAPLIRIGIWEALPGVRAGIGQTFETAGDALAIGCVLAGVRSRLHASQLYLRLLDSKLILFAPLAVLLGNALHNHPTVHYLFGYSLMNVGIALSIDWCVTYSRGRVGKFLNCRPVVFIGLMSYSIYLWQQIFVDRYSQSLLAQFPINLGMIAVTSLLSYYICEQPSFKLRKWLERRLFPRPKSASFEFIDASTATVSPRPAMPNSPI